MRYFTLLRLHIEHSSAEHIATYATPGINCTVLWCMISSGYGDYCEKTAYPHVKEHICSSTSHNAHKWIWFLVERLEPWITLNKTEEEGFAIICLDNVFLDMTPITQALKASVRMEHYTANKKSAQVKKLLNAVKRLFPNQHFVKD